MRSVEGPDGADVVLEARARRLAEAPRARADDSALHVIVRIGEHRLSLPAARARHAARPGPITPVPWHVDALVGLAAVDGQILPVADLAALLHVPPGRALADRALIVVDDDRDVLALLVDDVESLEERPVSHVTATDPTGPITTAPSTGVRELRIAAVLESLAPPPSDTHGDRP